MPPSSVLPDSCAIVGAGRLGTAMARHLVAAGMRVDGPYGRDKAPGDLRSELVLICVPDRAVADVAREIDVGPMVGHCSGVLGTDALAPHEGFVLHPLMTVTSTEATFRGAAAGIGGTSSRTHEVAAALALLLGMEPIEIAGDRRAGYHAAASIASNYLVTLACAAEELVAGTGVERRHLLVLARAALENWAARGAASLTGPIARGDSDTVERQREAVAAAAPDLLPLWDALATATSRLAGKTGR